MSKKIISIGLTIAGVALIATGIGAPLGTISLGAGLGAISVASVLGVGLTLAGSLLLSPKPPKLHTGATDRLTATLEPTTPRKIVFGGPTAGPVELRLK